MTEIAEPAERPGLLRRARAAARRGGLARALGGAALAAGAARAAQFAMAAVLARELGAAGFGQAAFALGVAMLAGHLAAAGWPALAVRLTGRCVEAGDRATLLRLTARARTGAARGAALAAAALLAAAAAAWAAGAPLTAQGLALAALIAPGATLRRLAQSQLAALFRPGLGLALEDLSGPAAALAWTLAFGASGPAAPLLAFAAAGGLAAAAGLAAAQRAAIRALPKPRGRVAEDPAAWPRAARALLLGQLPRLLLGRADMLLIAPLLGFAAAGLWAAALRLAYVVAAPPLLLTQALQPWISRAFHAGDRAGLGRVLGGGLAAIAGWTALTAGLAAAAPGPLLALFGAEFAPAAPLLAPLALAEGATALAAPLVVLAISGPGLRLWSRAGPVLAALHAGGLAALTPAWGAGLGLPAAAGVHLGVSAALAGLAALLARRALRSMTPC
jgi:O-antigen/teichoic acid export membrane protein